MDSSPRNKIAKLRMATMTTSEEANHAAILAGQSLALIAGDKYTLTNPDATILVPNKLFSMEDDDVDSFNSDK